MSGLLKKIIIYNCIGIFFFIKIESIKSINVETNVDGSSQSYTIPSCGLDENGNYLSGCGYFTENLVVRITVVDENNRTINGTKTIEISPRDDVGVIPMNTNRTYEAVFVGIHEGRTDEISNSYSIDGQYEYKYKHVFIGSSVARYENGVTTEETMTNNGGMEKYYVPLRGFDPQKDDWSYYDTNRKRFFDEMKQTDWKFKIIEDDGKSKTLLEFILDKTGYNRANFETQENTRIKLMVEPVYEVNMGWGGNEYTYRGTAKQLARVSLNSTNVTLNWFWPITYQYHVYNMYNNIITPEKVNNFSSFEPISREFIKDGSREEVINQFRNIYEKIAQGDNGGTISPMGIAIVDITEKIQSSGNCKYVINQCTENDFKYTATLKPKTSNDDIKSCVYPKFEADKSILKEYIDYDEDKDLWCYDNVEYDFNNLKEIPSTVNSNQMINIPNGKLRVSRTCYTSKSNVGTESILDTNSNNNYQETFKIKINGMEKTYKRTNTKTTTVKKEQINEGESELYKLTAEIEYEYTITDTESYNNKNGLTIDMNNLTIRNENYGTTNRIKIPETNSGKTIVIPTSESGKYENTLTAESLNNAFGKSNKLYNKVKNNGKLKQIGTIKEWTDNTSKRFEYIIKEYTENNCKFETYNTNSINAKFRVISLTNPFPGRDGTSRMPGKNWITETEDNVTQYIQKNRGVNSEAVYNLKPLYVITLNAKNMMKIRSYNNKYSYGYHDLTCESGTGRMCLSNFLRDGKYISNLDGECGSKIERIVKNDKSGITNFNRKIKELEENGTGFNTEKYNLYSVYDTNRDGQITKKDYINSLYYSCADKTAVSGG
jgi:hypothetical protein